MKKKWKQLSRLQRRMIIYLGLCNVFVLATQFIASFRFSNWMAGVSNGIFIAFVLDSFGFFAPRRSSSDQEVSGNE